MENQGAPGSTPAYRSTNHIRRRIRLALGAFIALRVTGR
jgi:hypothetical protein